MADDIEEIKNQHLDAELDDLFRRLEACPDDADLLARMCYELNIRSFHSAALDLGRRHLGRIDERHEFWYEIVLASGLDQSVLQNLALRLKDTTSIPEGSDGDRLRRNMAMLHLALGEDDQGRGLVDALRDRDEGQYDSRTYELLAESDFTDGDYPRCLLTCDRAAAATGPAARAIRLKGRCFLELGDLERAASCFRESLEMEPNFVRACHSMAILALESGALDRALRYFGRATFINPRFSGNYILLAEAFIDMRRFDLAEAEYRKLLLLEPIQVIRSEVHNALGYVLRKRGDFSAAKAELTRALDLDPQLAVAYYNLGCIAYREDDLDLAERHFNAALNIDPDQVGALVKLGLLNKGRKAPRTAERFFRQALEVNPGQAQAYLGLSELAHSTREVAHQLEYAELAFKYGPENADICNNLGIAYECSGVSDRAETMYLKAIEIDPFHSQAANNLGYLYEKKMDQDPQHAAQWKSKAIDAWKTRYLMCQKTGRSIKGAIEHLLHLGLTQEDIEQLSHAAYPLES